MSNEEGIDPGDSAYPALPDLDPDTLEPEPEPSPESAHKRYISLHFLYNNENLTLKTYACLFPAKKLWININILCLIHVSRSTLRHTMFWCTNSQVPPNTPFARVMLRCNVIPKH